MMAAVVQIAGAIAILEPTVGGEIAWQSIALLLVLLPLAAWRAST